MVAVSFQYIQPVVKTTDAVATAAFCCRSEKTMHTSGTGSRFLVASLQAATLGYTSELSTGRAKYT